jgi:hypothetical protein
MYIYSYIFIPDNLINQQKNWRIRLDLEKSILEVEMRWELTAAVFDCHYETTISGKFHGQWSFLVDCDDDVYLKMTLKITKNGPAK